MEEGKERPETGRGSSTDILSRIRETAASKPDRQIRQLTEENRRLAHELGITQVDLSRLQGEQEQLVEAYGALEKRHDDDVRRLTKELETMALMSAALEEERDSLKLKVLDLQSPGELKDMADKPKRNGGDDATSGHDLAYQNSAPVVSTTATYPPGQQACLLEDEVQQLKMQLDEAESRIKASAGMLGKSPTGSAISTEEDAPSLANAIEQVSRLNEQISQAAMFFGEIVVHSQYDLAPEMAKRHADLCQKELDWKLLVYIWHEAWKEEAQSVNLCFARLVIQALLVRVTYSFVERWEATDAHDDVRDFMKGLYAKIRDSGGFISPNTFQEHVTNALCVRVASNLSPLEGIGVEARSFFCRSLAIPLYCLARIRLADCQLAYSR